MCVVIDTNTLSKVFDPRNDEHPRFLPVLKWVTEGCGSVVFGGSKYNKELGQGSYRRIFVQLERRGRVVRVDSARVDALAAKMKTKVPDEDFDDEHIAAIVGVSKCQIVCTDDDRACPYLKRVSLYPSGVNPPKIYRSQSHAKFCCGRYVTGLCLSRSGFEGHLPRKPKSRPKLKATEL